MNFNGFCRRAGIYEDRKNFHAWVVENYGAGIEMSLEDWRNIWWVYACPIDGSTPPDVQRLEPWSQYEDSRDAAGM
jgi:hypothetical protein